MKKRLVVGIMGFLGAMGSRHHSGLLSAAQALGFEIERHLLDPRVTESVEGAYVYKDERSFLNRQFDMLILAIHPHHRLGVYRSLIKGMTQADALFVEKPLWSATTDTQTREVIGELTRKFGDRVTVNFPELIDPMTEQLLAVLRGEKAGVPELFIRQMFMTRQKDREQPDNLHNWRYLEALVKQESVHDIAMALYVFRQLRRPYRFDILHASGADMVHPNGQKIVLGGLSLIDMRDWVHDTHVHVENSFINPAVEKQMRFVCEDANRDNFTVRVSYLHKHNGEASAFSQRIRATFRQLLVYNEKSEIVYQLGTTDPENAWIIDINQDQVDQHVMRQPLEALAQGRVPSNFELAHEVEQICDKALQMQLATEQKYKPRR